MSYGDIFEGIPAGGGFGLFWVARRKSARNPEVKPVDTSFEA
jgi:hypothetical protein